MGLGGPLSDAYDRRCPAAHSLREVLNGLRWLVRAGAAWRLLPHDLPPWYTVYQHTQRWLKAGVFDALVQDLRERKQVQRVGAAFPAMQQHGEARRRNRDAGGRRGMQPQQTHAVATVEHERPARHPHGPRAALEKSLARHGEFKSFLGMRYAPPRTGDTLRQALDEGFRRFVLLPMYPHFSTTTTTSSTPPASTVRTILVRNVSVRSRGSAALRRPMRLESPAASTTPGITPGILPRQAPSARYPGIEGPALESGA